jgi:uncharacterized protein (DUF924 family)
MAITNQDIAEIGTEVIGSPEPSIIELETFSTKMMDTALEQDDRVKVPVYAKGTADVFNSSTENYEDENGGGADYKDVILDQHFKSTFAIAKQTTRFDMAQMIRSASSAVVQKANKFVYDKILAASFPTVAFTGAASTFDSDDVADLWANAQTAEFNEMGRSLVLTVPFYTALLKDPALKNWEKSQETQTLRKSIVKELNNFEVLSSNVLATSAGAVGAENLVGFITDRSALAVACSVPAIQDDEAVSMTTFVTQFAADNGMVIQFRKHYNPATGVVYGTCEVLMGATVAGTRLQRLISA